MQKIKLLLLCIGLLVAAPAWAEIRHDEILELSKRFEPDAYRFAQAEGARIEPFRDGRSYALWWEPEGFDPAKDTVFVSLHGHGGWVTKDFQVWHPYMKKRGYAFLAVQWWYGRSMEAVGYAKPKDIYPWIMESLERHGIPRGHVIFEGFSMGSANSYAVTYLDRLEAEPYFALTISNSGNMEADFKPNQTFLEQPAGAKPFKGVRWILYCAEHDKSRPQTCENMEWTKEKLQELGATVDAFYRDPKGGHGGFMKPEYADKALDLSDKIIAEN